MVKKKEYGSKEPPSKTLKREHARFLHSVIPFNEGLTSFFSHYSSAFFFYLSKTIKVRRELATVELDNDRRRGG